MPFWIRNDEDKHSVYSVFLKMKEYTDTPSMLLLQPDSGGDSGGLCMQHICED